MFRSRPVGRYKLASALDNIFIVPHAGSSGDPKVTEGPTEAVVLPELSLDGEAQLVAHMRATMGGAVAGPLRRRLLSLLRAGRAPRIEVKIWGRRVTLDEARASAPRGAEQVLCLLYSPERLPEKLGDFEEMFRVLVARQGVSYARRWYWFQVALAAAHQLAAGIRWTVETVGKLVG